VGIQHHRNEVAVPPAAVTPVTSNQAVNNSNANAASLGTLTSAQVAAANNAAGAASGAQNPIAYNASVGTPNPVSAVQSGSGFTTSVPVMGKAIDPTTGQLVKQWTGQYQNINSIPIQGETPEQNIQTLIANGGW
jgi:hypothetical protein